jgi:hypothetical protein
MVIVGAVFAAVTVLGALAFAVAGASRSTPMLGVIVAPGGASIEATGQLGAIGTLKVDRVVAPDRSWVAVYLISADPMAGGSGGDAAGQLVGHVPVAAGESRNVTVPLDEGVRLTEKVLVVLQADRGIQGRFQFDAARFETSPDKPYYVGGAEVSLPVVVRYNEMIDTIRP